jgi:glycosyltransferase involved in cell wall biosynthesis
MNKEISAVVPVVDRYERGAELAQEYLDALKETGKEFELIFVLDGRHEELGESLLKLTEENKNLRILQLAKSFGEAAAMTAGIEESSGEIIMTLPAYYQVEASEISKVIDELEESDVAIARRWPRADGVSFESTRRKVFHWIIRKVTGTSFRDLGCGVRAFKRPVVEEIPIYGDQHRFLPLLAVRRGFLVNEVEVTQSPKDRFEGRYGIKFYVQRLLDILTIVFLVRFTKKPLRFFGMIGSITFAAGAVFLSYIVIERLFFGVGLADRPALLLSSLLVVLGLQIFALGLLGELIIFTHAQDIKEYTIKKIVN